MSPLEKVVREAIPSEESQVSVMYSRFSFFMVVMSYKVAVNIELANTIAPRKNTSSWPQDFHQLLNT